MLDILNGFVVSVHTDIGQQTDVVEQIWEFTSEIMEKLWNGTRLFSSKGHLNDLISFVIIALIGYFLHLRGAILHLEPKGIINAFSIVLIVFTVEELTKNDLLVVSHDIILPSNERRK